MAQFLLTTRETKLDYYHQKLNVRAASLVTEQLKTSDLMKLGNFKKLSKMLRFLGNYTAVHPKAKSWSFLVKNCEKSAVKDSIEKPILLDFVNMSPTFCLRLSEETDFHFELGPDPMISQFLKILLIEKSHSLLKLIFKLNQLQKIPEYGISPKTVFCIYKNSIMNLRLNIVPGTAEQHF